MRMTAEPKIVCVIPVHNESTVIESVITGLVARGYEVVCVDDGSTDGSDDAIRRTSAVLLRHVVNLGQGAALSTGIRYAVERTNADCIVTIDADGQHRAEDVQALVRPILERRAEVVFATRFLDKESNVPFLKRIVLKSVTRATNRKTQIHLTDAHNGLRALSRRAASQLRITQFGMAHASEITQQVAKLGLTVEEVPATVLYTKYSRSKGQSLLNGVNILFDLIWK